MAAIRLPTHRLLAYTRLIHRYMSVSADCGRLSHLLYSVRLPGMVDKTIRCMLLFISYHYSGASCRARVLDCRLAVLRFRPLSFYANMSKNIIVIVEKGGVEPAGLAACHIRPFFQNPRRLSQEAGAIVKILRNHIQYIHEKTFCYGSGGTPWLFLWQKL